MSKIFTDLRVAAISIAVATLASMTFAQAAVESVTTTTTRGTVQEISPTGIAVTTDSSSTPVRYVYTKTTTYVDENGNPVSIKTVRPGVPVTVYYDRNGNRMEATRVVVRKTVTTDAPAETTTTANTTVTQTGPPAAEGFVSNADSDGISIKTDTTNGSVHYKSRDVSTYVDENGSPVSRNIKEGTPVTVFYERDGDSLLATRVVVRSSALDSH